MRLIILPLFIIAGLLGGYALIKADERLGPSEMFILIAGLAVGIIGFMVIENMSLTDAIYFSIVTMATVGYGDIHPQTDIGKILTLIIIICGVGTFLGVIASITDLFVNRRGI